MYRRMYYPGISGFRIRRYGVTPQLIVIQTKSPVFFGDVVKDLAILGTIQAQPLFSIIFLQVYVFLFGISPERQDPSSTQCKKRIDSPPRGGRNRLDDKHSKGIKGGYQSSE